MLSEMSDAQLQAIVDLTEARILKLSKDDLRMHEQQLLWSPELETEVTYYWAALNEYWEAYQDSGALPLCECDIHEINKKTGKGFMADPRYNPYFYKGNPCSLDWFKEWVAKNGNSK